MKIGKEEAKLFLLVNNMILYIKTLQKSLRTNQHFELNSNIQNEQKSVASEYTNNKYTKKKETRKTIPFTMALTKKQNA